MSNKIITRSLILGIPAGFVLVIIGTLTQAISLPSYIDHAQLYILTWILVSNLIQGVFFAFFFLLIQNSLRGGILRKGLTFGFILWIIGSFFLLVKTFYYYEHFEVLQSFIEKGFFARTLITDLIGYPIIGVLIAGFSQRYLKGFSDGS